MLILYLLLRILKCKQNKKKEYKEVEALSL